MFLPLEYCLDFQVTDKCSISYFLFVEYLIMDWYKGEILAEF